MNWQIDWLKLKENGSLALQINNKMNNKNIEFIFEQVNPLEELKSMAISLRKLGNSVDEIYNFFLIAYNELDEMDERKDTLGDFLDMITGYYVGKNIDLNQY